MFGHRVLIVTCVIRCLDSMLVAIICDHMLGLDVLIVTACDQVLGLDVLIAKICDQILGVD